MAILRRIVQIIKRSFYFYNRSVVFSIIRCESCRQLIAVVFVCIQFLNYFVKILLLKSLNIKMVVEIIKII
jgi:hypothetical protein